MKINAKENLMKGGLFNMLERQKEIVVEVGKYLFERGFTQLSGGNISVRDPQTNLVAIKPSGVAYGVMKPEDIIIVDINGNVVEGSLSPSIETGMHTGVYRNRPDVNAVIHCHTPYVIAWSLKNEPYIPTVTVSQYVTNGAIKVAPLEGAGSPNLAKAAVETLGPDYAIGLKGHGLLTCGPDMKWALEAALVTEDAAKIACTCKAMGGETCFFDKELGDMEGFDALARIAGL